MNRFCSSRRLAAVLLVLAGAWAPAAWSGQDYPNAHLLASVAWLRTRTGDPDIRIVDLRGSAKYDAGHIPGAVRLDLNRIRETVGGVPKMAASAERLARVFGGLGIDARTTVVAYDDVGGLHAARLFWTLEYAGHRRARILNGGYPAWRASGAPVSRSPHAYPPRRFQVRLDPSRIISAEEIRSRLGRGDVALVDARSAAEFSGRRRRASRGGHIPGAVHVEWVKNLQGLPGGWLPPEELARLYASRGVTRDKEVIPYCQTSTAPPIPTSPSGSWDTKR
ncbi:MAG: sulfurtransferase [Nitrospinota bacterium]